MSTTTVGEAAWVKLSLTCTDFFTIPLHRISSKALPSQFLHPL
ncbi:hypothetical protein S7335_4683 [Synechococcus sp. PCC 7335]|nr:hypothetical protein S7335_4683 [Synechococcus sp. PCC 7335]